MGSLARGPQVKHPRERGAALLLFAMIVFALMGLAAVAIDLGLASLTQVQMQGAVDTAVLEGVRSRDFALNRAVSDQLRREHVSEDVRMVFDDDMHPTGGAPYIEGYPVVGPDDEDLGRFGAGPLYEVVANPAMGTPGASGLLVVGANPVLDDPVLQANQQNSEHGDVVSGTFVSSDLEHFEDPQYTRTDFEAAAPASADRFNSLGLLVRFRRADGANPLDSQPGTSSAAPTLPLLFARGSTAHAASGSEFDPRLDGLTVRATAIAVARPAVSVGASLRAGAVPFYNRWNGWGTHHVPRFQIRGVAPVALDRQFWEPLPTQTSVLEDPPTFLFLDQDGDGVKDVVRVIGTQFEIVGRACTGATTIGARIEPAFDPEAEVDPFVYFPIYEPVPAPDGTQIERVIGYGYGAFAIGPSNVSIGKGVPGQDIAPCFVQVAPDNASAVLSDVALKALDLTAEELERVLAENVSFAYPGGVVTDRWQDIRPGTLLAPALVR